MTVLKDKPCLRSHKIYVGELSRTWRWGEGSVSQTP